MAVRNPPHPDSFRREMCGGEGGRHFLFRHFLLCQSFDLADTGKHIKTIEPYFPLCQLRFVRGFPID